MSRPLPRAAVPVLGTLLAVLCGVLVLAPVHRHPSASGDTLLEKLSLLLRAVGLDSGDVSPARLAVGVGTVIALVMVALPVLQSVRPDWREHLRTRPGAETAPAAAGTGELPVRSRERLRRRARAAGIAWRPAFDAPGGTRALVDLLDRVAPEGRPASARSEGSFEDLMADRPHRGPGLALPREDVAAEAAAPDTGTGGGDREGPDAPAPAGPAPTVPAPAVPAATAPAWTAGSVYTPTDLYGSSGTADPADAAVSKDPEDAEAEAGSTAGPERTP